MQVAELVREYLATILVWPVAIIVVAIVFREPIGALIKGVREGEAWGVKFAVKHLEDEVSIAKDSEGEPSAEPEPHPQPVTEPASDGADVVSGGELKHSAIDEDLPLPTRRDSKDYYWHPLDPPKPSDKQELTGKDVEKLIASRAQSWRLALKHYRAGIEEDPRAAMAGAWRLTSRHVARDRGTTALMLNEHYNVVAHSPVYPKQWRRQYDAASEVALSLSEQGQISASLAHQYLDSLSTIYQQHLDYMAQHLYRRIEGRESLDHRDP